MYKPTWHLSGKPYDVQMEALKHSYGHDRFGQFLEQGLGKTPLLLNEYVENFGDLDTIINICPNTFKHDWALAPQEWGVNIKTSIWPRDDMRPGQLGVTRMNIMNFESARASGHKELAAIMDKRPCLLAIDESSKIKNFKSQTAKAVLDLARRAKAVRLLNGTPYSQNVLDLFPQLKALGELQGVNPYAFRNRFAKMGGFMGKQVIGVQNEEELHRILKRCSFRALKQDWSDLPEKIQVPLHLEMTNKQRKIYNEMLTEFYTLVDGHEYTAQMILTQLDKLRQVASGVIMDGDKFSLIEEPSNNPKIRAALELLEPGSGKMVIVHFYTPSGRIIFDEMKKAGHRPAYIRGGMKPEEVTEQKNMFNNDDRCRTIVCQIGASHLAHTLLGREGRNRCHMMFYHDFTFSMFQKSQMDDRIHRGTQDRLCLYFHPVLSPIDDAQIKAVQAKKDMAAAVVDAVRALRHGRAS